MRSPFQERIPSLACCRLGVLVLILVVVQLSLVRQKVISIVNQPTTSPADLNEIAKPLFIIHAGAHKTATTALQDTLARWNATWESSWMEQMRIIEETANLQLMRLSLVTPNA